MYYSEYSIFISWQRIRIFIPDIPLAGWRLSSMAGRVVMWLNLIMWLLLQTIITLLILQYYGSAGAPGPHTGTGLAGDPGTTPGHQPWLWSKQIFDPQSCFWALFIIIRSAHNPLTKSPLQCFYFSVTTLYRLLKLRSRSAWDSPSATWWRDTGSLSILSNHCFSSCQYHVWVIYETKMSRWFTVRILFWKKKTDEEKNNITDIQCVIFKLSINRCFTRALPLPVPFNAVRQIFCFSLDKCRLVCKWYWNIMDR